MSALSKVYSIKPAELPSWGFNEINDMDQTKIWDYFQNEDGIGDRTFSDEARYRFLAKQVDSGLQVLNIGVGRGGLEKLLIEKNVSVSCIDPNPASIESIKKKLNLGDSARIGFSQGIPFEDSGFDVVIMSEVLEHLSDGILTETLREVCRVLRPGGEFIGTVPADEVLMNNRVVCPDCGKIFHRWGHVQSFSQERLRSLLTGLFPHPRISRHYFCTIGSLNWKGRILWGLKKLMIAAGQKGVGETFYFTASREK